MDAYLRSCRQKAATCLNDTNTPRAPPDGDALALLKNIKKRENGAAEKPSLPYLCVIFK
jgi:hypothetical protein